MLLTNKLKKNLLDIFIEIAKKETTFWQSTDLYFKALTEGDKSNKDEVTDETREIMAKIFTIFVAKNRDYCKSLIKGKFKPTNESLDKLEANFKEILKAIDSLHDKCPQVIGADYVANNKENIREAEKLIQLGREFANLGDKLNDLKKKENFSWQRVEEVWNEVKEKSFASRPTEWLTKTAQIQKWGFLGEIAEPCWEVSKAAAKGGKQDIPPEIYPSTAEELNFFQEIADEVPKMIDWLENEYGEEIKDKDAKIQEIKESNKQLKNFIQEQRKKRGSSTSTNRPSNKLGSPQDEQKIQNQQKEIDYLKQKLAELQNQIAELKKNQNNTTDEQTTSQIESLQAKKQQIQSELKQKQSQQKELKDKVNSPQFNTSQQNNTDKFNWLYVVIPGGILLVVMGIVIAYLLGKKNKKE